MGDERLAFGEKFNPYRKFPTGVWIPEGLLRYRGVSAEAKLLYGQLLRHAGENGKCFPTKKSLSTVLGVDERTIQRYIRELATNHHGYPFIQRRQIRPGVSANDYDFVYHPLLLGETKLSPPGESESSPHGRQDCLPQENNRKSSSEREKKPSPNRTDSPVVAHPHVVSLKGESADQKQPIALYQKAPSVSKQIDDDETAVLAREPHQNSETEFLFRLRERHPKADSTYILDEVKKALSTNGLSMTEYVSEDERRTTNPKALKNIPGYYVGLVKTMIADQRRATLQRLFSGHKLLTMPKEAAAMEKCPECGSAKGRGLKINGSAITFCACATDEFRREHETKESERATRRVALQREREEIASNAHPEEPIRILAPALPPPRRPQTETYQGGLVSLRDSAVAVGGTQ
jgi:hypothetical protein